jgi:hypothetical protein
LVCLFYLDQVPMEYRPPEIVYVEKFDPNRTDEQIKAQQDMMKNMSDEDLQR